MLHAKLGQLVASDGRLGPLTCITPDPRTEPNRAK